MCRQHRTRWIAMFGILLLGSLPVFALNDVQETSPKRPSAASFRQIWLQRVHERILPNGLLVLAVPMGSAPVVAFHTYVDVGAVDEPVGDTGLAHLFEHLAFKGTSTIGTTDWEREKAALEKMESAHHCYLEEKWRGDQADKTRMQQCWEEFQYWQKEAQKYVRSDEFGKIIEQNGGRGLNATTSADATRYFYRLPANRIELWFYLEWARFTDPVFREFYKERDVVLEEYRLRVENSPIGRLITRLLGVAFIAHPYGRPVIGFPSDLANTEIARAETFYRTHYCASNMAVAIVGRIDPDTVFSLSERYLARLPTCPSRRPIVTREPPQEGPRRMVIRMQAQPMIVLAYHIPSFRHPDWQPLEALSYILARGRSSRLYQRLVIREKIAATVGVFPGYPGRKYPTLMIVYAVPNPNITTDRIERTILDEIQRIQNDGITPEELQRYQNQALHDFYRTFERNASLAAALTAYAKLTGDWRHLFDEPERIRAVRPEDVQRVARTYLRPELRTVGEIQPLPAEPSTPSTDDTHPEEN